jgi:hypothetical protein
MDFGLPTRNSNTLMAHSDDGDAFSAAILAWHRLHEWPPNVLGPDLLEIPPPAGDTMARELIDWANVQVAQRVAEQNVDADAAVQGLSRAQLCMLMLLKHPDAFQRLQAWYLCLQGCLHRSEWDEEQQAIDPALRLLEEALRRLPPLAQATPGCRLVPVVPGVKTAAISVQFSIAFVDLMSPEAGEAALADAQATIPDRAFCLVTHDDISAYAVDVRPVIGEHRRAIRDCTLAVMNGRTLDPWVTLPLCYITHSGALTTSSLNGEEIIDPSPERTSDEPVT